MKLRPALACLVALTTFALAVTSASAHTAYVTNRDTKTVSVIETAPAKIKLKPGQAKSVALVPKPAFLAQLGIAKVVLDKVTLGKGKHQRVRFQRHLVTTGPTEA